MSRGFCKKNYKKSANDHKVKDVLSILIKD